MGELLHVSSSPHIRFKSDHRLSYENGMIVALMPATVAGVCILWMEGTAAGLSVSGNLCGDRGNL